MLTNASREQPLRDTAEWVHLRCSFCSRQADRLRFLAAGGEGATICDQCAIQAVWIFVKAAARRSVSRLRFTAL